MEHCSLEQGEKVAELLRQAVAEFRFFWEHAEFKVGVSIGLVPITAASASITEVMSSADSACYIAKESGRNRIHVYRGDDAEQAKRHGEMQWVSRIHQALDEDRFRLCFQTIVPLNSHDNDSVEGDHFELLLRLEDEHGRIVPPSAFLPAAERYGLSSRIDHWVVRNAVAWLAKDLERLGRIYLCSINLSGHTLADEAFPAFVERELNTSQVPPNKICFEITETAAIRNIANATRLMHRLKGMGCKFALDDFGSGLSSFAYLRTLPVDFLKIDGFFVQSIASNPIDLAMVRSINEVGHLMGKKTIAEYADNADIVEVLRTVGVDYIQGYGVGFPQPLEVKN